MKLELTGYEYEQRVWRLRSPKCPWLTKSKNKDLKIKHLKKSKKRVIISKDAISPWGADSETLLVSDTSMETASSPLFFLFLLFVMAPILVSRLRAGRRERKNQNELRLLNLLLERVNLLILGSLYWACGFLLKAHSIIYFQKKKKKYFFFFFEKRLKKNISSSLRLVGFSNSFSLESLSPSLLLSLSL